MNSAQRKIMNSERIKTMGIAVNQNLPMIEEEDEVTLKSLDAICKRAIASLLSAQIAIDASNGEYEESVEYFSGIMEKCQVRDSLNTPEQNILNGTYSERDIPAVVWEYECYWSLVWALGLISTEELETVDSICDCRKAISFVMDNVGNFKNICKLRSKPEILDELDFFYRLHWACVQNRIKPETPIGNMSEEVVMERRRGLEWLISEETDWFDVMLNT